MKRFNWQIWAGFLLTFSAFLSYPFLFIEWSITRDFPWLNLVLFAIAFGLLFIGIRRAFGPERRLISKVVAPILAVVSVLVLAFFIFIAFIQSRWLPASHAAPAVGQKAPDFTLTDSNNRTVTLTQLLTEPIKVPKLHEPEQPPKGVLLVFYRGYW